MYRSLRQCVDDLEATGQLRRIGTAIDPNLEIAEIQRRVYRAAGPALLFTNVVGCRFPMLGNLFGTIDRARYIFRDSLDRLRRLVSLQVDPSDMMRRPRLYLKAPADALLTRPRRVRRGPVLDCETTLSDLPQLKSWPDDGGAYITLPQVYSEAPDSPGFARSNLGMYRVQISGGQYEPNREAGMHYQIHRGIAVHHAAALRRGESLPVNVFVGGPPAMSLAAVMPMPEGISELTVAGVLGRRRVPMICRPGQLPIHAAADFCIVGRLDPERLKPEGPFGDHLGYYSMAHDFPVLRVEKVYHRRDAIWPFTVVGRPPQEDTVLGQLIHEIGEPSISKQIPGVRAVHAVDSAGVHPLLLAIGSERYVPYDAPNVGRANCSRRPTPCWATGSCRWQSIFGSPQARTIRLWTCIEWNVSSATFSNGSIGAATCTSKLARQSTRSTTAAAGINEGSKVVIAAAGRPIRSLPTDCKELSLPEGFRNQQVAMPGVLVVEGPEYRADDSSARTVERFCESYRRDDSICRFPLIVVVDRSDFAAANFENFLWTTFTRSNPATDIYGIEPTTADKHWGCAGSLVIDARGKPHHAPPLVEDPTVSRRVDELAARGGPLHGII